MKKYLLILLATMAFVACEDDSEKIDYSTWTIEELLTTGEGIDYLVSQTKEINYDELNERLKTEVLWLRSNFVYKKKDGEWVGSVMDGGVSNHCVLMDNNTFRCCFEPEYDPRVGKGYRTYNIYDNAVVEMVDKVTGAKIIAYAGDALVCEYDSGYGYPCRFLATFHDGRESILEEFTCDFDDPETWRPKENQ